MENTIDCTSDIKIVQACETLLSCAEKTRIDLGMSVMDLGIALRLVLGELQQTRADMYAKAVLEISEARKDGAE